MKQRLRLASVSPKLLDVYAEDDMTLRAAHGLHRHDDHARQEQVWEALVHSYNKEPFHIRRQLTEDAVRASDRRALFVGADAYQAAGGVILRDLFEQDDGGWLQDPAAARQPGHREAEERSREPQRRRAGSGSSSRSTCPYGHTNGLRRITGEAVPLTEAEHAAREESLRNEYDRLEEQYSEADELSDDVDLRLGEIETALAAFENRPMRYDPARDRPRRRVRLHRSRWRADG